MGSRERRRLSIRSETFVPAVEGVPEKESLPERGTLGPSQGEIHFVLGPNAHGRRGKPFPLPTETQDPYQ